MNHHSVYYLKSLLVNHVYFANGNQIISFIKFLPNSKCQKAYYYLTVLIMFLTLDVIQRSIIKRDQKNKITEHWIAYFYFQQFQLIIYANNFKLKFLKIKIMNGSANMDKNKKFKY
ncbi:hypothetical protein BpHYR1_007002 [Brachionus plicatilis]|uniref:Transmembrane protein n=1 Tax=Brachionus plicatilis TaxID=10195 RepID=A0A3M7QVB7_BRAPC|nr:hypothetical protein BpHYR1_007002 [Brachionus plicatilis]